MPPLVRGTNKLFIFNDLIIFLSSCKYYPKGLLVTFRYRPSLMEQTLGVSWVQLGQVPSGFDSLTIWAVSYVVLA